MFASQQVSAPPLRIEDARDEDTIQLVPNDGNEKVSMFRLQLHQNGGALAGLVDQCSRRPNDSDIEVPFNSVTVKAFRDWLMFELKLFQCDDFFLWRDLMVLADFYVVKDLAKSLETIIDQLLESPQKCFTCAHVAGSQQSDQCSLKKYIHTLGRAFTFGQRHKIQSVVDACLSTVEKKLRPKLHQTYFIDEIYEPCDCLRCRNEL